MNKYVLRPDLNDSTDFALRTFGRKCIPENRSTCSQKCFFTKWTFDSTRCQHPGPRGSQISTGNIFRNQIIKIMRSKTMNKKGINYSSSLGNTFRSRRSTHCTYWGLLSCYFIYKSTVNNIHSLSIKRTKQFLKFCALLILFETFPAIMNWKWTAQCIHHIIVCCTCRV